MRGLVFWPLITGISGGILYYAFQDIKKYPEKKREINVGKMLFNYGSLFGFCIGLARYYKGTHLLHKN